MKIPFSIFILVFGILAPPGSEAQRGQMRLSVPALEAHTADTTRAAALRGDSAVGTNLQAPATGSAPGACPREVRDDFCTPTPCGGHYMRGENYYCPGGQCGGNLYRRYWSSPSAQYYEGFLHPGGDACNGCGPCLEAYCMNWEDEQ